LPHPMVPSNDILSEASLGCPDASAARLGRSRMRTSRWRVRPWKEFNQDNRAPGVAGEALASPPRWMVERACLESEDAIGCNQIVRERGERRRWASGIGGARCGARINMRYLRN
jgi:hypothetical protein